MGSKLVAISVALLVGLGTAAIPQPAQALEFRNGDKVIVPADNSVTDDLYISAGETTIRGNVMGSLYVFGGQIIVEGPIMGDVVVTAGKVIINGPVQGSVRAMGGQLRLTNRVGGDVLLLGSDVVLTDTASIGRDVLIKGGGAEVAGTIGRNLNVESVTAKLSASVGNDAKVRPSEQLAVASTTVVKGTLTYRAEQPLSLPPGIAKSDYQEPKSAVEQLLAKVQEQIFWLLCAEVLLIAILLYARRAATRAAELVRQGPWKNAGIGALFLLGVPIALVLLTFSFVGLPLAAFGAGAYVLALYTAKLFPALLFGGLILQRKLDGFWSTLGAGTIGLLLYYALTLLPIFGPALGLAILLLGTGVQVRLLLEIGHKLRPKYGS